MSDNSSIGGALTNIAEGALGQMASVPKDIAIGAVEQLKPTKTPEEIAAETAEKQQKMDEHMSIQRITAEIHQISRQGQQQSTGPAVATAQEQSQMNTEQKSEKKIDEASRQAVGRAELGRGFKG